ncbi:uncharacterized protein ColSpa_07758 [Colletotrichum spaethianum]|uniref:Uncharacterized protein n=1 Tax=Colletotrichum spaethianum TaxID=700344 RepID=A0AA37P8F8_9PEZI|nr:uncharacterized protein ColSpa_07758 [Colletotrichum spaethianum]GKT47577.1 hypothetical protein ColSpa_07758 [Colletotrichum spaethianum]
MDQNLNNEGDEGDEKRSRKKSSGRGRGDNKKDCNSCKKGRYLEADGLKAGIEDAIESCPDDNTARRYHLSILQRINELRPNGADITRRTQAAILNDLTDAYEPMPDDSTIIDDGDRSHNHLWYSALIRRGMKLPAEWEGKPHISARFDKLRAVWEEAEETPTLRRRPAKEEAASNDPSGGAVDDPAKNPASRKRKRRADIDGSAQGEDEDAEQQFQEAFRAFRRQAASHIIVPSARGVNQPQAYASIPPSGYTASSMEQAHRYPSIIPPQIQPSIPQGYMYPGFTNQAMFHQNSEMTLFPTRHTMTGSPHRYSNQQHSLQQPLLVSQPNQTSFQTHQASFQTRSHAFGYTNGFSNTYENAADDVTSNLFGPWGLPYAFGGAPSAIEQGYIYAMENDSGINQAAPDGTIHNSVSAAADETTSSGEHESIEASVDSLQDEMEH